MVANMFAFSKKEYFELDSTEESKTPQVKFS
ncbi:MAG: hypothetical protein ACREOB_11005 [Thermodesulfobacteriota bacterium]